MKISLIMATLGRDKEVVLFLESLCKCNKKSNKYTFEVIIIDQNPTEFGLYNKIKHFLNKIEVKYKHSNILGLSFNRNLGLNIADGDIIGFPDDDCLYYSDTLDNIFDFFLNNDCFDFAIGRIFDRDSKLNILKKWPKNSLTITSKNFYFISSSITIFYRKVENIKFDEKLGVGAMYGSCEDPDFIYQLIKNGKQGEYTPTIEVWHPDVDFVNISLCKTNSYASGFGFMCKKNFNVQFLFLFILLICKKLFQFIFFRKKFPKKYFKYFFSGLYNGFLGSNKS